MTPTVQQVGFKVSYTMVPQGEIDESLLSFIYIFYIYFCGQQIRLAMDLAIYDVYIYIYIYMNAYLQIEADIYSHPCFLKPRYFYQ